MKFKSGILCYALASIVLLSGCATDNGSPSSSSASPIAQGGDIAFPLEQKETLTAFVMTPFSGENGDYNDNWVTNLLEEEENIKIDFIVSASGDDGKTKLNLLMASGDTLPDIFLSTNWTKAETMLYGQQGLILPLNDYLKDCENWNAINTVCPTREGELTMSDGNIYNYGNTNETLHSMFQSRMWIYKPWVDKLLGGKMPATTEELYTYLKAIKEQDPNGNGKQDEIPMTGCIASGSWATDPTTFITNAFLQNNNILSNTNPVTGAGFIVNDGTVEYQFVKDAYKDALVYLNRLYKEGLLDSQTFTQDTSQFQATTQAQTQLVGLAAGGGFPCAIDELFAEQPGPYLDWTVLEPVKGPDGVQLSAYYPNDYFGTCNGVVSKDCKNPELAVKLFDLLASEEWTLTQQFGKQGIGWNYVSEGISVSGDKAAYEKVPAPAYTESGLADYSSMGINFVKAYWDTDACILGNTNQLRIDRLVKDPTMNSEGILYECGKAYQKYKPDDKSVLPNMAYSESDARSISDYSVSIGQYVNQATVQFITGDLDVEKDWESYIGKINGMDLSGYIAVQQKAYDNYVENLK